MSHVQVFSLGTGILKKEEEEGDINLRLNINLNVLTMLPSAIHDHGNQSTTNTCNKFHLLEVYL